MKTNHPLFKLLWELDSAKIHYALSRHRDDTILVSITLVGERVEVDVFQDGHMEVSRFTGDESSVGGFVFIKKLIAEHRD